MALSAPRDTRMYAPQSVIRSYPVYQSTTIYTGAIIALNASGYAIPATDTAGLMVVGVAQADADNSSGNSADIYCQVYVGIFNVGNTSNMTIANIGDSAWINDDESVKSSGNCFAGTVENVDSVGVWVSMGLAASISGGDLTTFEASLASTSHSEGAALVGVEDSQSLISAATVETALTEIVKKANAALSAPYNMHVYLSLVTSTNTVARFTPGVSGTISKMSATVARAATTTGKTVILTPAIAGTNVSGAAITLASLTSGVTAGNVVALGGAVTGTSISGLASFGATDEITVVASSATAFAEGEVMLNIFFASA